eukprot:3497173-Pyramimonas_sp.AAC.1
MTTMMRRSCRLAESLLSGRVRLGRFCLAGSLLSGRVAFVWLGSTRSLLSGRVAPVWQGRVCLAGSLLARSLVASVWQGRFSGPGTVGSSGLGTVGFVILSWSSSPFSSRLRFNSA